MPRLSALFHNYHKNQKQTIMSKMQSNQLKWMDLEPLERYRIVGQVIDGMIYHPECVNEVKEMLSRWNDDELLKSIIMPDSKPDEEDNMCSSCNGTGEGSTPDTECWKCKGKGANINDDFYNFYD